MTACLDCGTDTLPAEPGAPTEYYGVHGTIWQAAHAPANAFLCVGCLESRLGRRLRRGDFTSAPVNDVGIYRDDRFAWSWRSDRLTDRLTVPADEAQPGLW